MKTTLFALLAFLGVFVLAASAADVSGKWSADVPGRDGNTMTQIFDLKTDGGKVTGTVSSPRGDMVILDGKIDDDTITFVTVRNMNGNDVKIMFKGKVEGDTIKFTRKRDGGDFSQEFVAKRSTT